MKLKPNLVIPLFLLALLLLMQSCSVYPSLTHNYSPDKKMEEQPLAKKIVVMKALDMCGHPGTSPIYQAYIPFVFYVRFIEDPESFVFKANGNKFDYEEDFAKLIAMDLQAAGISNEVVASPDSREIPTLEIGNEAPDYVIKLTLERLDWQAKYSMFGLSIIGFIPQLIGLPNTYGFSYLTFDAEIYDSKGKPLAIKTFSAVQSQNGWIFYDSSYLRALTKSYEDISPDFRKYVSSVIKKSSDETIKTKIKQQ